VLDVVPDRIVGQEEQGLDALGDPELASWLKGKLAERAEARSRRDFAAADTIRRELAERGVEVQDTPKGARWKVTR
jgi:cysteinyl-tRNA synthetase